MEKIAIFGGTFDPIHQGHLHSITRAIEQLSLDKVLLVPSYNVDHKLSAVMFSYHQRCARCAQACAHLPQVEVSTLEQQAHLTYSCHVVGELARQYPGHALYFLMGGDAMTSFPHWYQWQTIAQLATVVVMPRNPWDGQDFVAFSDTVAQKGHRPILLEASIVHCSSEGIRRALRSEANPQIIESRCSGL